MTRYTDDSRDRVKDAVDMLALVGTKVDLSRKGHDSYFGLCPFHDETTPSFHVRPDEKHYHCFGCAVSGDPFTFVMELEGLDFKGALEELAGRFGVTLESVEESPEAVALRERRERLYKLLGRVTGYYERYLWESSEAASAREYLLDRGLDADLLREFQVGYAPDSWDRIALSSRGLGYSNDEIVAAGLAQPQRKDPTRILDRFRGRIIFPTADARGRIRGFGARIMVQTDREAKYINTAEGELYHKREVLYGIDKARPHASKLGRMVLCEGYTDVIAMHQAGIPWSVGIMGTSLTKEQVAELVRSVQVLVLCLDADNAGQEAAVRAAGLAADQGLELRVVALPPGSDPADLLKAEGAQALRDRVERSVPYVVFEVDRILANSDLSGAEGKDRAITQLRPAMATVPASVLRDELITRSASRLEITAPRLVALLGDEPRAHAGQQGYSDPRFAISRAGAGAAAGSGRGGAAAARPTSPPTHPQHERSFLAVCVASPAAGAEALAKVDPEQLFTDPVMRRAAVHLKGHLPADVPVPQEDPELVPIMSDLLSRAARGRNAGGDEVEHARLVLENAALARELRYAQQHGGTDVPKLKARQQHTLDEIRAVVARLERPH